MTSNTQTANLKLSILMLLAGSKYFLFLHCMFPKLVLFHGSREMFCLDETNNFNLEMPWTAFSRLYLTFKASDTVELYMDEYFVCNCSYYELNIEGGDEALILLKSNSPVNGIFTVRQDIPIEKQLLAFIILLAGLFGLTQSLISRSIQ